MSAADSGVICSVNPTEFRQMSADLIYDWNTHAPPEIRPGRRVALLDETLRDGLQNPSVRDPSIEEKIRILHMMEDLGIEALNIGLPSAGPRAFADTEALAREIIRSRMRIHPNIGGRTHRQDIQAMIDICERVGQPIEAAVKFAVSAGLPAMYVTEDTMRTDPSTVIALYSTAIRAGARAIVLADTVGHATPRGAFNLVNFVIQKVVKPSGEKIRVDWHGHNDRGLAVANSLAAIAAGSDQVHAVALALGERVGNTPMETMLVNLRLMGLIDRDLSKLKAYSETIARATNTPIPANYPVVGRDAFRTQTGVHASAIAKARKKHDVKMADAIYSGVPAHLFGLDQIIEVGPMSGRSNVVYWLDKHGIAVSDELVDRILSAAKQSASVLTVKEILVLVPASARR